ncbi:enoyl-ACP reductase FabI [Buchnera aphidicola]|uniref:enoyl-ACP reductase FabI n=1 Tax=Buchnera aphidicola TaxID=9 RepID=UPI0031B70F27
MKNYQKKLLLGKKILITGVLNKYSIAYGIAKKVHEYGAELAFTYCSKKNKKKVVELAKFLDSDIVFLCNVKKDNSIKNFFLNLKKIWKKFDGIVHSIAFVSRKQLTGDFLNVLTRKEFLLSHEISSYSFSALAKESKDMLNKSSSLVTISYIGSTRVIPNYNVMGLAKASLEANVRYMAFSLGKESIRVNAISSGPIKTISSYVIKDFKKIIEKSVKNSFIKKPINILNIGNSVVFLFSELSAGITGQVIYVDGGFNVSIMS